MENQCCQYQRQEKRFVCNYLRIQIVKKKLFKKNYKLHLKNTCFFVIFFHITLTYSLGFFVKVSIIHYQKLPSEFFMGPVRNDDTQKCLPIPTPYKNTVQ